MKSRANVGVSVTEQMILAELGGHRPRHRHLRGKFMWKVIGIVAVVILGLIYFLGVSGGDVASIANTIGDFIGDFFRGLSPSAVRE